MIVINPHIIDFSHSQLTDYLCGVRKDIA